MDLRVRKFSAKETYKDRYEILVPMIRRLYYTNLKHGRAEIYEIVSQMAKYGGIDKEDPVS
jgi:hypothetical protein